MKEWPTGRRESQLTRQSVTEERASVATCDGLRDSGQPRCGPPQRRNHSQLSWNSRTRYPGGSGLRCRTRARGDGGPPCRTNWHLLRSVDTAGSNEDGWLPGFGPRFWRSEEHTSELQSLRQLV